MSAVSSGGSCPILVRGLLTVFALAIAVPAVGCTDLRRDDDLCLAGREPSRTTVLLLDTSDPLTPKHRAELERLVRELTGARGSGRQGFLVAPEEELVVYELPRNVDGIEPVIRVCNPGDPANWDWKGELTRGKALALRRWQNFLDEVEILFHREAGPARPLSPIIETLGVIMPRHVTSRRSSDTGAVPVHLILFSDLLQHSEDLSHYGPFPSASEVGEKLRYLRTDLSGVDVSLYRLERVDSARWQTVDHYYWWTKLVQEFGGKTIFQTSI